MTKRLSLLLVAAVLLFGAGGVALALDQTTATGEVVDLHCYTKDNAKKGEAHAGCAKKCLGGADASMGLLQADGTVVELIADTDPAAYKKLVDLAGKQAKVTGEKEGAALIVKTSGPAS
jgi:hypothetical protein